MLSGDYNTTFETYRLSGSVDVNNFQIETSVLYLTGKCFFEPLTGAEITVNDKTEERTTHKIHADIFDVSGSDSVRIYSDFYDIDLINNYNNDHLEITLIRRN